MRGPPRRIILLTKPKSPPACAHAYAEEREIVEGRAPSALRRFSPAKIKDVDGPIAVILSGRNVDMDLHLRVMNGETDPFRRGDA